MKVVSLFDGISCGLQVLKNLNIKVDEYHAFEIDKYAIQISHKNHPEIIRHGNVENVDWSQFKDVDLLIGGSPCQGFSFAGKQLAFDDPRSKLFFEFVKAKNIIKPKHFLLENVRMKKEFLDVITNQLKVDPVLINSALVSAQNRNRYYWCDWKVEQPQDQEIYLNNILESDVDDKYSIDFEGTLQILKRKTKGGKIAYISTDSQANRVYSIHGKSVTLSALGGGRGAKTGLYLVNNNNIRKLTPIECERLQGLKDNYTEGVSNTQRYKALGNGWNVPTIEHIIKLNKELK